MGTSTNQNTGNFRWVVCALLFAATTINYMDRQILGLLAPILEKEIGWSETQYSYIVMAFQAAYAIGLIGFGWIIDRVGTKHGYSLSIALWSIAAGGHALARSVFGFGAARFALGIGEAGNFPAAVKAVTEWFPRQERALATGIFNSGSNVGAIIAPVVVPVLTLRYGWQMSFIILGAVGFVWMALWHFIYDAPERSRRVSQTELAHIRKDDKPEGESQKIRWTDMLGYRQTWAYIVGMSFSAPVWWFYLYWLPKFLNKNYGLDLTTMGMPLVVIYTMTCFGSIGGGAVSSLLIKRGWSLNASRKTAMLACAICVVPVIFAAKASNVWVATLLIGLAAAAHQGWAANLFTLVSDLFPKESVASVVGLGAMFGSVTSIVFSRSVGAILEATGSYWTLFLVCGAAYLAALQIMHLLIPGWVPVTIKERRTGQ